MRVVLDTNVYISGLLVPDGTPGKILRLFERTDFVLLTSQPILDELCGKLIKKFGYSKKDAEHVVLEIEQEAEKIYTVSLVEAIPNDLPDNRVLECALDGLADVIVSGDKKHLQHLGKFKGIPILSPAEFLRRYFHG